MSDYKKIYTYVDMYENYENPYNLSRQDFRLIVSSFNVALAELALETGGVYKMPGRSGMLSLARCKTSSRPRIDFAHYHKTGEVRPFRDFVKLMDSQVPRWIWHRITKYNAMPSKQFTYFRVTRENKRAA